MSEANYYFDTASQFRPFTVSALANAGSIAPDNALRKKPTFKQGYWPCESGGKWVQIEDHREKKGWLNGEETTITELGPLPDGWNDTKPDPSPEEVQQQRKADIMNRLSAIDFESVRPLRALANNEASEEDVKKLAALDAEAASLREELSA